jgi:tRNA (guanine26-N2/guanine27-N2)-dimethyltransferase
VPEVKDISATPSVGQRILHNGKRYTTVKEGLAHILVPDEAGQEAPQHIARSDNVVQTVFYNPIQQFNRDLSVLAIKAYGEQLVKEKEAEAARRRKNAQKNKKRKREEGDNAGNGVQKSPKTDGNADGTKASGELAEAMDVEEAAVAQPAERAEAQQNTEGEKSESNGQTAPQPASFTILDALSASGLRALRYSHEIPFTTSVTANDYSAEATKTINMNVEYNKLGHKIKSVTGDAKAHMYQLACEEVKPHKPTNKYDVIDLDPYGTAVPFLDAAVQSVRDGGLLCVTCTDAGVWASNGYPEKCYSLYGGLPLKGMHSHEGGLRLILHSIATAAAKYGLSIEPLLSLSIDFYARVFVKVWKSPADVKFLAGKTIVVHNCDQGCGAWSTETLSRNILKRNKSGKGTFWKHVFSQAPNTAPECEHCGKYRHLAGPMWGGPLHSRKFIQKILDDLPTVDKDIYHTTTRIEGMLTLALEEEIPPHPRTDGLTPPPPTKGRADASILDPYPFFFIPSVISKVIHCVTPDENALKGALRHAGYRVTRSHAKPGAIKTDAPWSVIWHVMREWVAQKSPVKEGAIPKGTAGYTIMGYDKKDEETGETAETGDKTEEEKEASKNWTQRRDEEIEAKTGFEVEFDEKLGRETDKKKLVRYQMNPRENWGPMGRAKPMIKPAAK